MSPTTTAASESVATSARRDAISDSNRLRGILAKGSGWSSVRCRAKLSMSSCQRPTRSEGMVGLIGRSHAAAAAARTSDQASSRRTIAVVIMSR